MRVSSKNILVWLIYALSIGLFFFPININNLALAVLLLFCAFIIKLEDVLRNLLGSHFSQLLIINFILLLFGLIYTDNLKEGLFVIEKRISFLLIPLFLTPTLLKSEINHQNLFKRIGEIGLIGSFALLLFAVFRKYILHYDKAFYFESFRSFEGFTPIHYVYFAMFFGCASLFFIDSIFEQVISRKFGAVILSTLFLYSLTIMILVSSKTGIGAFLVASGLVLYYRIQNKKVFLVAIFFVTLATGSLFYINETTRDRFLSGLAHDTSILFGKELPKEIEFTDLNMRLVFWRISLTHLWQDNLWIAGVGTGDVHNYLDSLYSLPQYSIEGYLGWNSHNQWVSSFIQLGLAGLISMAAIFLYGFFQAFETKNVKFLVFLVITFAFSLTESIFELNKGIVFFSLFIILFTADKKA
jgi:hypothetical protein